MPSEMVGKLEKVNPEAKKTKSHKSILINQKSTIHAAIRMPHKVSNNIQQYQKYPRHPVDNLTCRWVDSTTTL